MTGRTIDHIVLAVDNLDQVATGYQALGFTLTPRASHDNHMGTANRLIQLTGKNFIEILEVDRPTLLENHDFQATPPRFSFGAHNRAFVTQGNGISMLVFASDDARADIDSFHRRGLQTYAPFDFQRKAKLPDGNEVVVGFSLGFVTSPTLPGLAFFVCQQHAPEYFWKPDYQRHANGAQSIASVYLAADEPDAQGEFLASLFDGEVTPTDGGLQVACGPEQTITVLTPERLNAVAPCFAGITLTSSSENLVPVTAQQGSGMFIDWRPA